jgi:hypothetical protein
MRWPCVLVAVAALTAGCGDDRAATRQASAEELGRAEDVVRSYLDAAAREDRARLCELRTDGVLSRWGGQRACERRAKGLLLGPYRHSASRRLKRNLTRRGVGVDAAAAKVLDANTSGTGDGAGVWVDYGKAILKNGRAVGGSILTFELKREHGEYRIARVGFAAFAD